MGGAGRAPGRLSAPGPPLPRSAAPRRLRLRPLPPATAKRKAAVRVGDAAAEGAAARHPRTQRRKTPRLVPTAGADPHSMASRLLTQRTQRRGTPRPAPAPRGKGRGRILGGASGTASLAEGGAAMLPPTAPREACALGGSETASLAGGEAAMLPPMTALETQRALGANGTGSLAGGGAAMLPPMTALEAARHPGTGTAAREERRSRRGGRRRGIARSGRRGSRSRSRSRWRRWATRSRRRFRNW